MPTPLRSARLRAQLTPTDLSRLTGLSVRTIYYLEQGVNQPRYATRRLLAQALGMELHDLWPQHTPPPPVAIGGPRPAGDLDAAIWAYRLAGDSTGAGELIGIHSDGIRKRLNRAGARPRPRGGSNPEHIESLASWARKLVVVSIGEAVEMAAEGRVPGLFQQQIECAVIGVRWAVRPVPANGQTGEPS